MTEAIVTCVQKMKISLIRLKEMEDTQRDEDGCFVGCLLTELESVIRIEHFFRLFESINQNFLRFCTDFCDRPNDTDWRRYFDRKNSK